jgi:hypothetical protein
MLLFHYFDSSYVVSRRKHTTIHKKEGVDWKEEKVQLNPLVTTTRSTAKVPYDWISLNLKIQKSRRSINQVSEEIHQKQSYEHARLLKILLGSLHA